jgi:hypothetical protein
MPCNDMDVTKEPRLMRGVSLGHDEKVLTKTEYLKDTADSSSAGENAADLDDSTATALDTEPRGFYMEYLECNWDRFLSSSFN